MHVDSAIVYRADIYDLCAYDVDDMGDWNTELPVLHFIDLLHDTLFAPWRLEDVGFIPCATPDMMMLDTAHGILCVSEGGVWMNHMRVMYSLTTFTDLLTLMRMLTPPSND